MTGARPGGGRFGNCRAAGFSLMEVVMSVTIFVVIILSATGIFKLVIDSQRSALAAQNVQESLKYFFEVVDKEIRMAQINKGVCPGIPNNRVYTVTTGSLGDSLSFRNYYNQCVTYSLVADGTNQRFQVSRNGIADFISPKKIKIDTLHFILNDLGAVQPMVTLNLRAHALDQEKFQSDMVIQTSLTSRYYKE
ncbi:MAG: hypothetical protein WC453_00885 [Patescibacteria group bacterium]